MTLKRLLTLFALLSILISSLAFAAPAAGQIIVSRPANEAAEICRQLDEEGGLDFFGAPITRGECVNFVMGPASANANNFIVAICGTDLGLEFMGTTNKGQCIKVLNGRLEEDGP